MNTQALLLELLVSGFFAIACFKARAAVDPGQIALRPRDLLRLTDRVERLSRSRWQWFAMVGILILVRMQAGVPLSWNSPPLSSLSSSWRCRLRARTNRPAAAATRLFPPRAGAASAPGSSSRQAAVAAERQLELTSPAFLPWA